MAASSVPSRNAPSVMTARTPRLCMRVISMLPIDAAAGSLRLSITITSPGCVCSTPTHCRLSALGCVVRFEYMSTSSRAGIMRIV
jgi:hypothetical protein